MPRRVPDRRRVAGSIVLVIALILLGLFVVVIRSGFTGPSRPAMAELESEIPQSITELKCRVAELLGRARAEADAASSPLNSAYHAILVGDSTALRWFYGIVNLASRKACSETFVVVPRLRYAPPHMSCNLTFSGASVAQAGAAENLDPSRESSIRMEFFKARFLPDLIDVLRDSVLPRFSPPKFDTFGCVELKSRVIVSMGMWDVINGPIAKQNSMGLVEAAMQFSTYLETHHQLLVNLLGSFLPSPSVPSILPSSSSPCPRQIGDVHTVLFREASMVNCSARRFAGREDACRSIMRVLLALYNRFVHAVSSSCCHLPSDSHQMVRPVSVLPLHLSACRFTDGVHCFTDTEDPAGVPCYLAEQWGFWRLFVQGGQSIFRSCRDSKSQ